MRLTADDPAVDCIWSNQLVPDAPDPSGPADPPPRQPDGRHRPAAGQRPRRRWPRQPRAPSCGSRKTRLRPAASASVVSARYRVVVRNLGPATARAVSLQEQGRSPARGHLSLRTTKGTLPRHSAAPLPRSATCAAGQRATITVTVRPRRTGRFPNVVAVHTGSRQRTNRGKVARAALTVVPAALPRFTG